MSMFDSIKKLPGWERAAGIVEARLEGRLQEEQQPLSRLGAIAARVESDLVAAATKVKAGYEAEKRRQQQ